MIKVENTRTDALPGSIEKIQVMRQRLALRLPLFHPEDAQVELPDVFLPAVMKRCKVHSKGVSLRQNTYGEIIKSTLIQDVIDEQLEF